MASSALSVPAASYLGRVYADRESAQPLGVLKTLQKDVMSTSSDRRKTHQASANARLCKSVRATKMRWNQLGQTAIVSIILISACKSSPNIDTAIDPGWSYFPTPRTFDGPGTIIDVTNDQWQIHAVLSHSSEKCDGTQPPIQGRQMIARGLSTAMTLAALNIGDKSPALKANWSTNYEVNQAFGTACRRSILFGSDELFRESFNTWMEQYAESGSIYFLILGTDSVSSIISTFDEKFVADIGGTIEWQGFIDLLPNAKLSQTNLYRVEVDEEIDCGVSPENCYNIRYTARELIQVGNVTGDIRFIISEEVKPLPVRSSDVQLIKLHE